MLKKLQIIESCLCDKDIIELMKQKEIKIENFVPENLGPNSYDLRLYGEVRVYKKRAHLLNVTKDVPETEIRKLPHIIYPGETMIFITKEIIACKSCTFGLIFARSSLSLLPINMSGAGLLDTGFAGRLKGSITNVGTFPIEFVEDYRMLQILFFKTREVKTKYSERDLSKFMNQVKIPTFKIDKEWRNNNNE